MEKTLSDHALPLIFEPNEGDKADDPLTWKRANPLLADNIFQMEGYRTAYEDSQKGLEEQINFKIKILNQYEAGSDSYLSIDQIDDAMLEERIDMDPNIYCWVGIDDTIRKDLGAITTIQLREGIWYVDTKFFSTHKRIDYMTRVRRLAIYIKAVEDGDLIPMGNETKDSDMLMKYIHDNLSLIHI